MIHQILVGEPKDDKCRIILSSFSLLASVKYLNRSEGETFSYCDFRLLCADDSWQLCTVVRIAHMDGNQPYALLFFIPVLWLLIGWTLSKVSGWSRLAQNYRAKTRCEGEVYHFQSGRMGSVSYGGCWSIFLTTDGFFLSMLLPFRFGHPPLFIPWKDIHDAQLRSCLGYEWMKYQVGRPTVATIQLPKKIVERVLAREDFRTL